MQEAHLRQLFDSRLAASADAIQREAQRMARFRLLRPSARAASAQVKQRFAAELARPVVERLRPGWTYEPEGTLTEDELFASGLFQRIPITRFEITARIRGAAHGLAFELHEVAAAGEGDRQYARILLNGLLAHVRLAAPVPGHVRFCHRQMDKMWRRPSMDGYLSVQPGNRQPAAGRPNQGAVYEVHATPDALPATSLLRLATTMDDLAWQGWRVHAAFGGLSAWVAIERSRTWFEPRALPPYTADDVLQLDAAFTVVERIAGELRDLATLWGCDTRAVDRRR